MIRVGKILKKKAVIWERLVLVWIVLSFVMIMNPIIGSRSIVKESVYQMNGSHGIIISGWLGENGWYVSAVQITFNFSGHGSWPNPVFFKIDNGAWEEYSAPIIVGTDGEHTIWMYYIDDYGNQSEIFVAYFNIDTTLPTLTLSKETLEGNEIKFVANVSDATSGIWRVEFYLDAEPVFIDYNFPFETRAVSSGNHNLIAFVFDVAGHSEIGSISSPVLVMKRSLPLLKSFYSGLRMTFMESFAVATR